MNPNTQRFIQNIRGARDGGAIRAIVSTFVNTVRTDSQRRSDAFRQQYGVRPVPNRPEISDRLRSFRRNNRQGWPF